MTIYKERKRYLGEIRWYRCAAHVGNTYQLTGQE